MRSLTLVLTILGVGLLVLVFNHDSGQSFGMNNEQFGRLVYLFPIAALLGAGILVSRRSWGENMRHLAIWILIALALVTAYLYRHDAAAIGDRLLAGLMPGRAFVTTGSDGAQEVILQKAMNGHFQADVVVNGQSISMLVDTGASMIALTQADARRAGIPPEKLTYSMTVMTANGLARAAPVTLDEIAVGPIVRRNVRATVAERGRLDQSLLGMSFLATLSSLQMQTDELRLRD